MVTQTGTMAEAIELGMRPDGTPEEMSDVRFPDPKSEGVLTIDDTALDAAGLPLENVYQLMDLAVPAAEQSITITDPTLPVNPIVYVSSGFLKITGYELGEVLGRNCRFLGGPDTDPTDLAQIREAVRDGRPHTAELCNYRKDGTRFWNEMSILPVIDMSGRLTKFIGVQVDITQRRQLKERHHQSPQTVAIEQLMDDIAHDINNMLTIIIAYGDLLRQSNAFGQIEQEALCEISKAGERAASLTQQLLAFRRKRVTESSSVE